MHLRSLALVFLSASLLAPAPPVLSADEEQTLTFNLNDADIRAFIATVSELTGKNFIIDPRVKGKVTVVSGTPISPDRVYEVFLSVLKVHGYAAVPSGDAIKIVPDTAAKQDTVPTISEDSKYSGDKLITRVVQVSHANAAQLVPILRPLLPKHAHLAAHSNSNTLVVTDSAANIDEIVRIIQRIDQANNRDVEIIPLRYSEASDLEKTLISLSKVTIEKGQPSGQAPLLIADERTNSLILSGDPGWRSGMRLLISQLDMPVSNDDNTEVIYLRYASAKDLVNVLRGVGTQQLKAKAEGAKAARAESRFDIQADEATNALVVTAPPFLMRSLKTVIGKLDIRRAQVQIEAIIAELRTDKSSELGIEWLTNPESDGVRGGTSLPVSSGATSSILGYPTSVHSGLSLGYFRGGDIRALLKAFASDDDTNILSTPTLVTLDNEEAMIHVGQNVPFITGQYTNDDATAATNPFQTIERHDVGIKLKVTPHINDGDTIKMKIEQEVSSVDSDTSASDVVTNNRIIQTTVLVDNQEIIVLGGLVQDTLTENVAKVPLLGDIPLLGLMFQNRHTSLEKRNLMVFLRPVIIRDQKSGIEITNQKYDSIRRLQLDARKQGIFLMPNEQTPVLPEPTSDTPLETPASESKEPEEEIDSEPELDPFNPFAEYQQYN